MAQFRCDTCSEHLSRKKIDIHRQRCRDSTLSCTECGTVFAGTTYRAHTSCEAYRASRKMRLQSENGGPWRQNSNYRKPYVEGPILDNQVAKVEVPPPAPSPPRPNVFDFLVSEKSSPSASESQKRRHSSSSTGSASSSARTRDTAFPQPRPGEAVRGSTVEGAYSYGNDPVQSSAQKYSSDVGYIMDVDSNPIAFVDTGNKTPAEQKTPAVKHHPELVSSENRSEKKRKRQLVDDWDDSGHHDSMATSNSLHSGLTGGLHKMMGRSEAPQVEDSPSSPKKRSKRVKEPEPIRGNKERATSLVHTTRSKGSTDLQQHRGLKGHHLHSHHHGRLKSEAGRSQSDSKPYSRSRGMDTNVTSNSGLFLGMIDKGYRSHKGQSIWGTLKSFHEMLSNHESWEDYEACGARASEEKALMKGLRMKLNRQGEIVLFSRPDRERDGSPGEEEEPRRKIEGDLKQIEGPR